MAALKRQVEGRVARAVLRVETRLGAAWRGVEKDAEESSVSCCRGAVKGVLVCAVACVDLRVSASATRKVREGAYVCTSLNKQAPKL